MCSSRDTCKSIFISTDPVYCHACSRFASKLSACTHKVIHIVRLSTGIAVRQRIMCDKIDLVLVDKIQVKNPWCIFDNLVHPPTAQYRSVMNAIQLCTVTMEYQEYEPTGSVSVIRISPPLSGLFCLCICASKHHCSIPQSDGHWGLCKRTFCTQYMLVSWDRLTAAVLAYIFLACSRALACPK